MKTPFFLILFLLGLMLKAQQNINTNWHFIMGKSTEALNSTIDQAKWQKEDVSYRDTTLGKSKLQNYSVPGRWTMWSEEPAKLWRDAFVTGNGRHGTMVMGKPGTETITCVHEELFLAAWDRSMDPLPDIAHVLPEVRRLIREDQSKQAIEMAHVAAREQLAPKGINEGWPVVTHPAFDLNIKHASSGEVKSYKRSLNLETGEAFTTWTDEQNNIEQRVFSSRIHNVNVISLRAKKGTKLKLDIKLVETPGRPTGDYIYRNIPVGGAFRSVTAEAEPGWLFYHADYAIDRGGYEGVGRVTIKGGTMQEKNGNIHIQDADEVLIVLRIKSLNQGEISERGAIKKELNSLPTDYNALIEVHAAKHGDMFNRVKLDLGCQEQWKETSTEKLLSQIESVGVTPHFLEMGHAMGRYLLISTCGRYPAPLQGIWGAGWTPAWGGSFTTDSNVNLAISSAAMGNLPECAESYFGFVERQLPGWRANALKLMGCKGIMASINTDPETGYETHYTKRHFFAYWPGGTGWNIRPFYDYGLLTGDHMFMKNRVLPLYLELDQFYEDFLEKNNNGTYNIIPSLSPENIPTGTPSVMVVENSTFDVAVARETYAVLTELGSMFNLDKSKMERWKYIRDHLPEYRINKDGALAEWIPEKYKDNYSHRHNSHLYPIFPGIEFLSPDTDPALLEAAKVALKKRYKHDTSSAHGLIHIALMSARLNDAEKVQENLERLSTRRYYSRGFVTSHNPDHEIYNLDASLSLPRLLMEMLVFSRSGFIELLPAWPAKYADGTLKGVLIRGGHKMDISWKDGKFLSATLYAGADDSCEIKYGTKTQLLNLDSGKSYHLNAQLEIE